MIFYRKALPLEIVDGIAIWPLEYLTPIDLKEEEIARIIASHVSYASLAMSDTSAHEIAEAILTKLKGE